MTTIDTLILGAGLTGLSAGYHLGKRATVVEGASLPGGTASTLRRRGFQLDHAVHVLSVREPWTLPWIRDELDVTLQETKRKSAVWFEGRIVPYPLQFHLSHLRLSSRLRYSASALSYWLVRGRRRHTASLGDYERANQGAALVRDFLTPYNLKVWGVGTDQLGMNWANGYIPEFPLSQLLRGVVADDTLPVGHNATFFYPREGGIGRLADAIASKLYDLRLNKRLVSLDYENRVASFSDGTEIAYKNVISTLPLVELIDALRPESSLVEGARAGLQCNSLTIAHVLIPRSNVGEGLHWLYVPETDAPFYRVSFPHNICDANCPAEWSALTVEIGGEITDRHAAEVGILRGLRSIGLVEHHERDVELIWDTLKYGYVVSDLQWEKRRAYALTFLKEHGILSLGRYGRWEYSNMESALSQGRSAPRRLQSMTSRGTARRQPVTPTQANPVQHYFETGYPSSRRGPLGMVFRRGEDARLRILRSWIPSCEGLALLDAGCGDAVFLSKLLHGRPRKVRLVDFVAPQVAIAWNRLQYSADEVEAETCELQSSTDTSRYDIVLAMGVFDYTEDWPGLLRSLMRRSEGLVIADFPKARTLHAGLRRIWLAAHHVSIQATHRDDLDAMLQKTNAQAQIVELPLQWIVRIQPSSDPEDMGT